MDEHGEGNHRPAQRPQHTYSPLAVIKVESPGQIYRGRLKERQPEAACEEPSAKLALGQTLLGGEKGACSGEKNKGRRAEVSDPPRKKYRRGSAFEIGGREIRLAEKPAHMVKRHEHHHQATHRSE